MQSMICSIPSFLLCTLLLYESNTLSPQLFDN